MDQADLKQLELLQQAEKERMDYMKKKILPQILTPEAKQRLANIKLTKPDKAETIELQLCQLANQGKIQKALTEEELITLLEAADGQMIQDTKVTPKQKLSKDEEDEQ